MGNVSKFHIHFAMITRGIQGVPYLPTIGSLEATVVETVSHLGFIKLNVNSVDLVISLSRYPYPVSVSAEQTRLRLLIYTILHNPT